jgi:hypothetical protein
MIIELTARNPKFELIMGYITKAEAEAEREKRLSS